MTQNNANQNAPGSGGAGGENSRPKGGANAPYAPGPHGLGTPIAAPVVKPSDAKKKPKKPSASGSQPPHRPAA
jgi:hypothetical protein